MKVLYVKTNSQRAVPYQIRTILYEEDGIKYVKKQAISEEAIPHLKKMKENYQLLTSQIIGSKIKLAKILEETKDSLTFEYIDGVSAEVLFAESVRESEVKTQQFLATFMEQLEKGFNTQVCNEAKSAEFTHLFGEEDYAIFSNKICTSKVSNIDCIFSNIIYKDDIMYIIDYEWVYPCTIPLEFILFRAIRYAPIEYILSIDKNTLEVFTRMEKYFQHHIVNDEKAFSRISHRYAKDKLAMSVFTDKERTIFKLRNLLRIVYRTFFRKK